MGDTNSDREVASSILASGNMSVFPANAFLRGYKTTSEMAHHIVLYYSKSQSKEEEKRVNERKKA